MSKCCETGSLNTRDDNWERGETNLFVGRQLGQCENHPLFRAPTLTVKHK